MPYSTVVAATTISASWANANIRDQVVTPFANTGARDSAITSPIDGMLCTISGTDTLMQYTGSGWVIVWEPKQAWSLTTISQGASNPTCTTTRGWYQRSGGIWHAHISLAITSAGTLGSGILVGLPLALADAEDVGGSFVYTDAGTANYVGSVFPSSTGSVSCYVHNAGSALGATPSFACAAGDSFRIDVQGTY